MSKEFEVRVAIQNTDGFLLSSVWHFWSRGEEIYIAPGRLSKELKTSLHSSGKYRHAFVSQKHSDLYRMPGLDRAVYKWERPAPQSPLGRLLFQVLLPGSGLSKPLFKNQSDDVLALDVPNSNEVLYLSLVELIPNSKDEEVSFGDIQTISLTEWSTPGGMRLRLVAHIERANVSDMANWEESVLHNAGIKKGLQLAGPDIGESHTRASILMNVTDGIGRIFEIDIRAMRDWAVERRSQTA